MHDDPSRAEEVIQQRLALLALRHTRRRLPSRFGLRGLFVVFTLAPILIWRLYLAWPTIISTLNEAKKDGLTALLITRVQGVEGRVPLIVGCIVPVIVASTVLAMAAFVIVRRLREHAKHGALAALCCCGTAVIVTSVFWIGGQGGFCSMANAHAADVVATYVLPSAITVLLGAIAGWRVAELE